MERIVQLTESEYNKLYTLAKKNEKEIEAKAEELYKSKGVYAIDLTIGLKDRPNSSKEFMRFYAHSYLKDWNNFTVPDEDKRRFNEFVERKTLEMMQDKFGKQIESVKHYNDKIVKLQHNYIKFLGLTILGWLCAIGITLITILG